MIEITQDQMVEAIYKEIANKELSEWCRIKWNINTWNIQYIKKSICEPAEFWWTQNLEEYAWRIYMYSGSTSKTIWINDIKKIEWHPVMIGDVLNKLWWENIIEIYNRWYELLKPIEDQSKECKEYIYNKINK